MESIEVSDKFNNPTVSLALDTIGKGKQALVFVNTKRSAEKTAEDISHKTVPGSGVHMELSDRILKALSRPTRQCERLAACVAKGIAFHHAGLTSKQRSIVEDSFRDGTIRIICCTPSLAQGVDLPAFRAILKDLRRYGHRGLAYIPVLEYLQMAGRAGRPNYDTFGEAIIIASSGPEKEHLWERYIEGEPEEIYSKLAAEPALRTSLLSLIASNFVRSRSEILDFYGRTFWAFQYKDMAKLETIIDKMLELLQDYEFIRSTQDSFASADELEDVRFTATVLGKRVAELYLDPVTARGFIIALRRAPQRTLSSMSFLQLACHTLELRPLLRVKVREYDEIREEFAKHEGNLLENEPSAFDPSYDDFLDSVKTALFMQDWIDELDEEDLLEKYDIRPGEIRAKLDIADWLVYSMTEFSRLMQFQDVTSALLKVRQRLKYGVKEELLALLKLRQIGRVRARALYRNGIRDIAHLKRTDVATISQIVKSRKVAEDVKRQLGQDVEPVSPKKRKGQKSVQAF
jgi:helicase